MNHSVTLLLAIFGITTVGAVHQSYAGISIEPPTMSKDFEDENYPESEFGRPPADAFTKKIRPTASSRVLTESGGRGLASGSSRISGGGENSGAIATETAKPLAADLVPDAQKGIQEISIIATDLGFFPKTVFLTQGIPARLFLTGASKNTLCLMLDSFNVRKQIRTNKVDEVTFTPTSSGVYRFYCPINGMEGSFVVRESFTNARGVASE